MCEQAANQADAGRLLDYLNAAKDIDIHKEGPVRSSDRELSALRGTTDRRLTHSR
jgi:hypothetical protein